MHRRAFIAGSLAGLTAHAGWAEVGAPALLTAAIDGANRSWLIGLTADAQQLFKLPIPSRGHAAAAHPTRPETVAFARRPGRFAIVIDCANGRQRAVLDAPNGRHFYGHGAFTADGAYLLTTENDFDAGAGRIGIWDVAQNYKRIDEVSSGGIGPHEIIRLSDGGFAVANGGIQTHPDSGRTKLNLPQMHSNLAFLDAQGAVAEVLLAPEKQRKNSIRHIDSTRSGDVVIALQWQGDPRKQAPVAAIARPGQAIAYLDHPQTNQMKHYGGSVAVSPDDTRFFVTGPKGGHVLEFDVATGAPRATYAIPLASGVAALGDKMVITSRAGLTMLDEKGQRSISASAGTTWDNHLVRLRG